MNTRKFAIKQAARIIASTNIEQKQKAVFDLADEIEKYICNGNKWYNQKTQYTPKTYTEILDKIID